MKCFTTIICLLFTVSIAFSQIVDKTEEKAKKKTNQRVDKKIDDGIDSGLDALEGLFSKKKSSKKDETSEEVQEETYEVSEEDQMKAIMGMMGGNEIDETFDFQHNFLISTEQFDKKGESSGPIDMKLHMSEEHNAVGFEMEGPNGQNIDFMIFDPENDRMLMMMTTNGQKMGFNMPIQNHELDSDVNETGNYNFRKTGNSKTISGYHCQEYLVEDLENSEDYLQYFWMSKEAEGDWIKAFQRMANNSKNLPNYEMPENYPEGAIIQVVSIDKKDESKTVMTVEEINLDSPTTAKTKGYSFMALPSTGNY